MARNSFTAWIAKQVPELEATAVGVLGKDRSKEIIVYCDTGRLYKRRWFVLREILEYKIVSSREGSKK